MPGKILVIGATGHFGARIARRLAQDPNVTVAVSSRSELRINDAAATWPDTQATLEPVALDLAADDFEQRLATIAPDVVIHTAGPFQGQRYTVASACIANHCHYIDLADDRRFVCDINVLNEPAREAGVTLISGASTLPGVSSAVVNHFADQFKTIDDLAISIAPSQRAMPGASTVRAVLQYAGAPIETRAGGESQSVHGWQDLTWQHYPGLGRRLSGACDVPDLELMPERLPDLKSVRFHAALESTTGQLMLAGAAGLRRLRLLPNAAVLARPAIWMNQWLQRFGGDDGAMQMVFSGSDHSGGPMTLTWNILATDGDGPEIPCTPAVLLARQLVAGELTARGAMPCMGLLSLDAILGDMTEFAIATSEESPS